MTTPYIDPNLIFAENAPVQDKPAAFSNYNKGWDESRNNDGRPLIPQMNYLTQQADLKNLYIHENGAALPYKDGIAYEENAVVVKDGVLQQWKGGEWVQLNSADAILDASGVTQQEINDLTGAPYRVRVGGYNIGERVVLENGDIVKSTVAGNTVDPNVDMTGWEFDHSEILLMSNFINSQMSDTEQTQTVQNVLSNRVKNGMTVDFRGIKLKPTTSLQIEGLSDVKLINIDAEGSESWVFTGSRRGIIRAVDCPNVEIKGKVKGVKKTNPNIAMATALGASGRFQDGDAGIELIRCNGHNTSDCEVHHVKTWGIMALDSKFGSAHNNTVYDCVRQSGISLNLGNAIDSESNKAYNNTIYMCGLYGIEVEKQGSKILNTHVYDNNIWDCQAGVMLVNSVQSAKVHDNNIFGCYYGMAAVSCNQSQATELPKLRNFLEGNTLVGNYSALAVSKSKYVTFGDNPINGFRADDYFITSPYNTVEKIVTLRTFYSVNNFNVNDELKINNIYCKVVSSVASTDPAITELIGIPQVYLVTVDTDLTDVSDFTIIKKKLTSDSYGYNEFFEKCEGIHVLDNDVRNVTSGINVVPVHSNDDGNIVAGNSFDNVSGAVYSGQTVGYKAQDNTYKNCLLIAPVFKLNGNNIAIKPFVTLSTGAAISGVAVKPTDKFYNSGSHYICKLRIKVKNVSWDTAATNISLVPRLNGVSIAGVSVGVAAKNTDVDTFVTFVPLNLVSGENTLGLVDTTGRLSFDSMIIDVYCVD